MGVGVDVVSVDRIERAVARHPRLLDRVFRPEELVDHDPRSLAVRFAAKEAARKALGGHLSGVRWRDAYVVGGRGVPPKLVLDGTMSSAAQAVGVTSVHLSLSHERGLAVALVVMEG